MNETQYVYAKGPIDHPRRKAEDRGRRVYAHVLIAEKALGKYIPADNPIHHVNGNRSDNRNENLVICESHAYHHLLHMRTKALVASGNPDMRKCRVCKAWDFPENLHLLPPRPKGQEAYHNDCALKYKRVVAARTRTPRKMPVFLSQMDERVICRLKGLITKGEIGQVFNINRKTVFNVWQRNAFNIWERNAAIKILDQVCP